MGRLPPEATRSQKAALRSIADAIRSGPVTFAGGALESGRIFEYAPASKSVVMAAELWRELCLLGHWISDAVIVRWAALTERLAHRQSLRSGDVLPLLLAKPAPERVTLLAREIYRAAGIKTCVWSTRQLSNGQFDVDHVIPFALWGNNDLWNLLPAHPAVNNDKADRLPTAALLQDRRDAIVTDWRLTRETMPQAFDKQTQNLLRRPAARGRWELELFDGLREAVQLTALQRGIDRWVPRAPAREFGV
jgi:hypothetical protein